VVGSGEYGRVEIRDKIPYLILSLLSYLEIREKIRDRQTDRQTGCRQHPPRSFATALGRKQPRRVLSALTDVLSEAQYIVSGSGSERMRGGVSKLPSLAAGRACSRSR
jgi:hypothetical protein